MIRCTEPRQWIVFFLLLALGPALGCSAKGYSVYRVPSGSTYVTPASLIPADDKTLTKDLDAVIESVDADAGYGAVAVLHPYREAMFPADMAAPLFAWQDPAASQWLLVFSSDSQTDRIIVLTQGSRWSPGRDIWDVARSSWTGRKVRLDIFGLAGDKTVLSRGSTTFFISRDPANFPVLYQEMPLPFGYALKHVDQFNWRLGDISAYNTPKTVMEDPPSCMFCHTVSGNGKTFGMDMDFKGDKGGYILTDIHKEMMVSKTDIISWNTLPHPKGIPNMGLFSKISHDGEYVVTTVNEKPFMITMDNVDFSQLFFPITGRLGVYARKTGHFFLLPGADDPAFVHTSPVWTPDGKQIIFARARVNERFKAIMGDRRVLLKNIKTPIEELNKQYQIQYDLYAIPFNGGRGGTPVPIDGASFNGASNYFPRISPDGQWIVFNRSDTGIVAQPGATLYMVPVGGGTARRMNCNTAYYNSWHSFAPNGRWLVFTSKVDTPYTQLFLAHIDEKGMDAPPVLLWRFHQDKRAAVIPEFVNIPPEGLSRISFSPQIR